jgi:hypothetical protein
MAVDPHHAALGRLAFGGFMTGAEIDAASGIFQHRRYRPGSGSFRTALAAVDFRQLGPAQAAARRQEGKRFKQVRLAGAIGSDRRTTAARRSAAGAAGSGTAGAGWLIVSVTPASA